MTMKGTLLLENDKWIVEYWVGIKLFEYEIHPKSITDHISEFKVGKEVEFELVDEFTEPSLYKTVPLFEGIIYAKLK